MLQVYGEMSTACENKNIVLQQKGHNLQSATILFNYSVNIMADSTLRGRSK